MRKDKRSMNKLEQLREHGQSIWYDNIQRELIRDGGLAALVDKGVLGMTSNPTIFERAITRSDAYDLPLLRLALESDTPEQIYEALVMEDIRDAAEILRPVFDRTDGEDGYVSLEVRPTLADDTAGTIEEAKRLFSGIGAPNLMIKVPATEAGIPAIRALIGQGINVNVTLIFSPQNYREVAQAYIDGLEDLIARDGDPRSVSSVASFFVSRIDTAVDRLLDQKGKAELRGKAGIANSKVAYQIFREVFSGERWEKLMSQGARVQRPLWASTSTKDDRYPDTMYVDALIGPETVNTIPPATLDLFLDHGTISDSLLDEPAEAQSMLERLSTAGVDLAKVAADLQAQGVRAFTSSYTSLLSAIETKSSKLIRFRQALNPPAGDYEQVLQKSLEELKNESLLQRVWDHDYTLWKPDPKEITNRLGWLDLPTNMQGELARLHALADEVSEEGFTHAILLGMGGSSLAPDVFMRTFGAAAGYLQLTVLDSTHPDEIRAVLDSIPLAHTLFIVSTKSGKTVETLSLFRLMYNRVMALDGSNTAGSHFIGVTDPDSPLVKLAHEHGFRELFLNDPNIGGRYSALSFFGLVPAASIGADIDELLARARLAAVACDPALGIGGNPAASLGALMGELALAGKDKLTFVLDPELESFADWLEQLLAESTGKEGKGILPVAGEALLTPDRYRQDRLFAWIHARGSSHNAAEVEALRSSGQPVVEMQYEDKKDLGGLMFIWELATAIAGERLGINPFNQPNVEAAKIRAREMVAAYEKQGELPDEDPAAEFDGIKIFADGDISDLVKGLQSSMEVLHKFLEAAPDDAYIALQAYLQPGDETIAALQQLRTVIQRQTRRAVTLGIGPRFLHSTGQLHKGDAGHGMFVQFSDEKLEDLPIPRLAGSEESEISFGVLIDAQVRGDFQALRDRDRRVLRMRLSQPVPDKLKQLTDSF
jgi:transaldolase/glucose-6-phosphate isomerase